MVVGQIGVNALMAFRLGNVTTLLKPMVGSLVLAAQQETVQQHHPKQSGVPKAHVSSFVCV